LQINDGSNATGLNRLDAYKAMEIIEACLKTGGVNHAGASIPIP
jgi:hypothetical protein